MRPLKDRIIVRLLKEEEKTKSGIFIPEVARNAPQQVGEVLAVGPWQKDVKVGEKAVFVPFAGTEVKWTDGSTVLIIEAVDLVAVMED